MGHRGCDNDLVTLYNKDREGFKALEVARISHSDEVVDLFVMG